MITGDTPSQRARFMLSTTYLVQCATATLQSYPVALALPLLNMSGDGLIECLWRVPCKGAPCVVMHLAVMPKGTTSLLPVANQGHSLFKFTALHVSLWAVLRHQLARRCSHDVQYFLEWPVGSCPSPRYSVCEFTRGPLCWILASNRCTEDTN